MKFSSSLCLLVVCLSLFIGGKVSAASVPEVASVRDSNGNVVEGAENAPIQITMFFDPLGQNSARHWREVRAPLVENYVKTGSVRITYLEKRNRGNRKKNDPAIAFVRCMPAEKYADTVGTLLEKRALIKRTGNLSVLFEKIAKNEGVTWDRVSACMADPERHAFVKHQNHMARRNYDISDTPNYFIVGTPYRFSRYSTYKNIDAVLRLLLNPQN